MARRKKSVQEAVDAVEQGEGDQIVEQPVAEEQPVVEVQPQVMAGPETQPLVPVKPTIDLPVGTEFRPKTMGDRQKIFAQQKPAMDEYYQNPQPIKFPKEKRYI